MEKPWLHHYPAGVPANINPDQYSRVIDMVEESFQKYADQPAFIFMGKTMTFRELDEKSAAFGAYLRSRGLEPGDRVALMMPNLMQYPIAMFGVLRAGLILVNTNPLYTPREMKHQFIDSGAKAILIAENFAHNLEQIIGETQIKTVILTSIGEMLGLKGSIVNFVVRRVKKMVPKYKLSNTVCFNDAIKQGRKFTLEPFKGGPDDTIALQYTGGTTGVSKGTMLTNRNLLANMMQIRAWLMPVLQGHEGEQARTMCALPLYHIFSFTVNCLAFMSIGACNILIVNARDLPALIKEWDKYKPHIVPGVNTLFNGLLNQPAFHKLDFSSLRACVGGAMAVQRAVAERWQQVTGCQLTEGYGMTESSPVLTVNPVDSSMRLGTIGMPVPSTEVRIVDESYVALPAGPDNVGEIQARGPQVMKGYWQRPEATAETIKDGWLCTGDMGFMHPDGFFQIVDRKKDMILVSGFNVYPNEIEDVLALHPKVLESAAIGLADEKSGEVVKVFIVKRDESLTEEEVIAHCRENLTNYKVPRKVEFRKDLPKTNVGKILRRELRDTK
ncbi:MAG: AMP-binding protein [Saprospiraceae bacterium]|nr:AMP-binding protein [Saprospiraceae bacterium]